MIRSTMQRAPLSLNQLLERAGRLYPESRIVSRLPDKSLVRHRFADHPSLDAELLVEAIGGIRLPVLGCTPVLAAGWPGLLRAAQILGMVADPNLMLKLTALFLELKEVGQHEPLGLSDASVLRARYPDLFCASSRRTWSTRPATCARPRTAASGSPT